MEWQSSFLTKKCYPQKITVQPKFVLAKKTAAENENLPQSLSWL